MNHLHIIAVNETAEARLQASGAELTICISGQSFFTGNEAFKKAAEVHRCIEAIKECGIAQDDISIQNVTTAVESGILTKTSSATYYLGVRCASLECLGPTLAAISSQKNTKLMQLILIWNYASLEETQNDLLQTAVKKAKATAQLMAESLGTRCSAIHKLSYTTQGVNKHVYANDLSGFAEARHRKKKSTALQEFNIEHKTKLVVAVAAEFVVEPFDDI